MSGNTMAVSLRLPGLAGQSRAFFSLTLTNKKCSRDDALRYI